MKRRTFLAAGLAATVASVAGCGSGEEKALSTTGNDELFSEIVALRVDGMT